MSFRDKKVFIAVFCHIFYALCLVKLSFADSWHEVKGNHFIVQFFDQKDRYWAKDVLRKSENYYTKIAAQIGYQRYQDFWTWEDRVKITIYPDQRTFVAETGQPPWSKGAARRDNSLLKLRSIITYRQEDGFLDGILPHEIAHLIFRDLVGFDTKIPLWFDEGIAQLQQQGDLKAIDRFIRKYVKKKAHIPFRQFHHADIRKEVDPYRVALFYAQSWSVVNFLILKYGSHKFYLLCKELKEGKPFETALRRTYGVYFSSLEELEKKWLSYIQN